MEHFLVLIGFESNRIVYAEVQISAKQCGLPIGNLARHWVSPSATKDNTYHRGRPRGYIRRRRMVTKGGWGGARDRKVRVQDGRTEVGGKG